MSKYEPLRRYLEALPVDSWQAGFKEVEKVLGFSLPDSAHRHQAWWANQSGGSQSQGWQPAGWQTCDVNLRGKSVKFERRLNRMRVEAPLEIKSAKLPSITALMQRAKEITGITDQDKLVEAGLAALIQREAGKHLAALGGSMPDAWVPDRERPLG